MDISSLITGSEHNHSTSPVVSTGSSSVSAVIVSVLSPFVPAPVLSFARSYLPQGDFSQSTLGSYAPSWLIEQLPLLMSLIAGYVAIISAMRAARVAFR